MAVDYNNPNDMPIVDYDINKVPPEIREMTNGVEKAIYGWQNKAFIKQGMDKTGILVNQALSVADGIKSRQDSLEVYTDTMMIEMTDKDVISAPEIIQARGGKATLGQRLDETTAQLAQTAVNIKTLGAVGGDVEKDTLAFNNAHELAMLLGSKVYFPVTEQPYLIDNISVDHVTSMYGNDSEIHFIGDIEMLYNDNFELRDLIIENDYVYTDQTTRSSLFKCDGTVDNIIVDNILFNVISPNTSRGKSLIVAEGINVSLTNIRGGNSENPILIKNTVNNNVSSVNVENVHFKNTQTLIYLEGKSYRDTTSKRYIDNVTIRNVSIVNTVAESDESRRVEGADVVMGERVRNMTIDNITGERCVERVIYLNEVINTTINDVNIIETEGIKVVGNVKLDIGYHSYSKNVVITNVKHKNGGNNKQTLIFYDVEDVSVDGVQTYNQLDTGIDVIVDISNYAKNVYISNVKGKNMYRGAIHLKNVNGFHNYKENIIFKGFYIENPSVIDLPYAPIRIEPKDTDVADVYFRNIKIIDFHVSNYLIQGSNTENKNLMFATNSRCGSLVVAKMVDGLEIINSTIKGSNRRDGGFAIDESCTNVVIDTKIPVIDLGYTPSIETNVSLGSNIEYIFNRESAQGTGSNNISALSNNVILGSVSKLADNHSGKFIISSVIKSQNRSEIPTRASTKSGLLKVYDDKGNYMHATYDGDNFVKIDGTELIDVVFTFEKIGLEFDGSRTFVRNGLSEPTILNIEFIYTNLE